MIPGITYFVLFSPFNAAKTYPTLIPTILLFVPEIVRVLHGYIGALSGSVCWLTALLVSRRLDLSCDLADYTIRMIGRRLGLSFELPDYTSKSPTSH